MKSSNEYEVRLHLFSDASEAGYGVVAYVCVQTKDEVNVSFVISKSRVAPLKTVTIPRLDIFNIYSSFT